MAGAGALVPCLLPLCKGGWEVRLVLQHIRSSHLRVPSHLFDYVLFYFNISFILKPDVKSLKLINTWKPDFLKSQAVMVHAFTLSPREVEVD